MALGGKEGGLLRGREAERGQRGGGGGIERGRGGIERGRGEREREERVGKTFNSHSYLQVTFNT